MPPHIAAKKPRCFVAMALGHADTDRYYQRLLKPVLKRNGILPVIITARQRLDDLNIQIMEELQQCDLCVADLTYARQSVYFEAGYAQRVVPVIYTVRSDHLGKNQPEDLRVHFDLSMKPMINWSSPSDATFQKRFETRLRQTFLKQWDRKAAVDHKLQSERLAFAQLSVRSRAVITRRVALKCLRTHGFPPAKAFPSALRDGSFSQEDLIESGETLWTTIRKGEHSTIVVLQALNGLVKKDLHTLAYMTAPLVRLTDQGFKPKQTSIVHLFVLYLQPVPDSRIQSILPAFVPERQDGRLHHDFAFGNPHNPTKYRLTLDCISNIQSPMECEARFVERLNERLMAPLPDLSALDYTGPLRGSDRPA